MSIFGNKKDKNNKGRDSGYALKLLTELSGEIIKKRIYTRFGVGFIKLTAEYSARITRSQLDTDRYLVDELEELVKIRQEDANDTPKSSKDVISIYETLPELIKAIKIQLNDQERKLEKLEKSKKEMLEPLNGLLEEIDKLKKAEKEK